MKKPAPTRADARFQGDKDDYGARSIRNHLSEGTITDEDARLIIAFSSDLIASTGCSPGRSNKLISLLCNWRRWIPPYTETSDADLLTAAAAIRGACTHKGARYTPNAIIDHIQALKQFYRWMVDNGHSTFPLDKLTRIKKPAKPRMIRTANDILTTDEITRFIAACQSSRDRAIFSLMYEGGLRGDDIGTLTWRQLKFDRYGSIVNLDGKTGKPRYIRLIMSTEALAAWQRDYPCIQTPDALVFIAHTGAPVRYHALTKQMRIIAKRAGITKHLTLHLFRHSRITHLIREGISIAIVGQLFWGDPRARELSTYLHLVNEDIDNALLGHYGITASDSPATPDQISPRQCPACHTISGPTADHCPRCGIGLTETARQQQQDHLTTINQDAIMAMVEKVIEKKMGNQVI